MLVEIVSDVVCPWCFIGKRRFERAAAEIAARGAALDLDVRYRAFMLDPTAPEGNPQPVREAYAKKFGGATRAEEILRHVTQVAANEGIEFHMDRALRANTRRAHRLLKLVERDAPSLQSVVNEAVMTAYFCDGSDIHDVEVLLDCASRAGYAPSSLAAELVDDSTSSASAVAVAEDLQWVSLHDVTAVPTFIINAGFAIPGAQDTETFVRILERLG